MGKKLEGKSRREKVKMKNCDAELLSYFELNFVLWGRERMLAEQEGNEKE
jgi:hypothetical protein